LHQHTYRVAAGAIGQPPAGGADAALEAETDHARAAADVSLGHPARGRSLHRLEGVRLGDVEPVDVAQVPVPGFGHHRETAVEGVREPGAAPLDHRVAHGPDAVGVGDGDRVDQQSVVVDPGRARHFAVPVEAEPSGEYRIQVFLAPRKDGGDAGSYRPLPDHQFPRSPHDRDVSNRDAGNVGDRVERARRAFERYADVAGALRRLGRRPGHQGEHRREQCAEHASGLH
jgi:hypothetical protein